MCLEKIYHYYPVVINNLSIMQCNADNSNISSHSMHSFNYDYSCCCAKYSLRLLSKKHRVLLLLSVIHRIYLL